MTLLSTLVPAKALCPGDQVQCNATTVAGVAVHDGTAYVFVAGGRWPSDAPHTDLYRSDELVAVYRPLA